MSAKIDKLINSIFETNIKYIIDIDKFKDVIDKHINFNKKNENENTNTNTNTMMLENGNLKQTKSNEKITIRFRLSAELSKLSKLVTYKALEFIFKDFCNELKRRNIFSNYFKVISINFRKEMSQGYIFLLTVLSETNSAKTHYRITTITKYDKNIGTKLVSKSKLYDIFEKHFVKIIIKNNNHFNNIPINTKKLDHLLLVNEYIENIYSHSNYLAKKYRLKPYSYTQSITIIHIQNEYILLYKKKMENDFSIFNIKNYINNVKKKIYTYKFELDKFIQYVNIYNNIFLKTYKLPYKPMKSWFYMKGLLTFVEDINEKLIKEIKAEANYYSVDYIEINFIGGDSHNDFICSDIGVQVDKYNYHIEYSEIDFISFCNLYKINECQVCFTDFYRKKCFKNRQNNQSCHHKICPTCFNQFVLLKMEEYTSLKYPPDFKIMCPISECKMILIIIKKHFIHIVDKFYKFLSKSTIEKIRHIKNKIYYLREKKDKQTYMTRKEAEKELKVLLNENTDKSLTGKINICPNRECNTIIYKSTGCMAVICSECGTKLCIKCGYFDIVKELCNCEKNAITPIYFEARQEILAKTGSSFQHMSLFV